MDKARWTIVGLVLSVMLMVLALLYSLAPRQEASSKPVRNKIKNSPFKTAEIRTPADAPVKAAPVKTANRFVQKKVNFSKPFAHTFSADSAEDTQKMSRSMRNEGKLIN